MVLIEAAERRFRHDAKSPEQLACYYEDLVALVLECGIDRVEAGMRAAWTRKSWMPEPAFVRQCMPAPASPAPAPGYDPMCESCRGSGWKIVTVRSDLYKGEERRAMRCDCNTRPRSVRTESNTVVDIAELKQQLARIAATCSVADSHRKQVRSTLLRKPCAGPPALQFTPAQIEARKDAERVEIYRMEQAG